MKQLRVGWGGAGGASNLAAWAGRQRALGVVSLLGVAVLCAWPAASVRGAESRLKASVSLAWKAPKKLDNANLVVSEDGKRFAYRDADGVVVDGQAGRTYKWVGYPLFSPDGRNVAYAAGVDGATVVVLNGADGAKYSKMDQGVYSGLMFSPDGSRLAYPAAKPKGKWVLVVDGTESAEYDSIGDRTFSADGERLAFAATRGQARLLVVDGQERDLGKAEIWGLTFSPDGAQFAYATRLNKVESVTVGDATGDGFERVGEPYFSVACRSSMPSDLAEAADEAVENPIRITVRECLRYC